MLGQWLAKHKHRQTRRCFHLLLPVLDYRDKNKSLLEHGS